MVEQAQQDLERAFMCKHFGELTKYVGSKLTLSRDDLGLGMVKFIQLVLVQKLEEEFTPPDGVALKTPAVAGQVLVKEMVMQWYKHQWQRCTNQLLQHACT